MRLIVSTSLESTAEHFWALRSLAQRIAKPFKALFATRDGDTVYQGLTPQILNDIGLPARTTPEAEAREASRRAVAACIPADAYWTASGQDPFASRVPFAGRRRVAATPAFKAHHVAPASVTPAPSRAERIDARLPFAGLRLSAPARRRTPSASKSTTTAPKPAGERIDARVPFARSQTQRTEEKTEIAA